VGAQTGPGAQRGAVVRWAGPIAALVLLSIAAIVTAQRGFAPSRDDVPPATDSQPGPTSGSSRNAGPGLPPDTGPKAFPNSTVPVGSRDPGASSVASGAGAGHVDTRVAPRDPGNRSLPTQGPPERTIQSRGPSQGAPVQRPAIGTVSAGSATELSRSLTTRLIDLLRERGVAPAGAVRVTLEMSTRPAPFQANATTADWVATVRVGDSSRSFDGHVLGFSELSLRKDVVERAAEALAAFLATGSTP
jgi:hypothetical protein